MGIKRCSLKRALLSGVISALVIYTLLLLVGDLHTPKLYDLTEITTCPACYGNSICHELYSGEIFLESSGYLHKYFNAKNIYHGLVVKTKQKVLLKKLAHNWELELFDEKLCEVVGNKNCKHSESMDLTNVDKLITSLIEYNFSHTYQEPKTGIVLCPYLDKKQFLLQTPMNTKKSGYKSKMINIWTMLSINPEPIILQLIPKSKGWPVPAFGGVCGRIAVVSNEGQPLSSMMHIPWQRKLILARKILYAAIDFTNKHNMFRFYLMDWSLDNIVANDKDNVTFVDLEDVVVLDKNTTPKKDLPNWYQKYTRDIMGPGFTFSIENLCRHHLSDHNIWAACYILAGDDNPWLIPVPQKVNQSNPNFENLLNECLNGDDRFHTVVRLQRAMDEILAEKTLFRVITEI